MRHNHIHRILALLLVLALIVVCILLATPVRAAECRLVGKPEPTPWEPDEAEVLALARTLYGECRGCSELQQRAVCWCIFNRVDSTSPEFPDTIIGVVSAPSQLQGYSPFNPVWESLYGIAYSCMVDWHNGENRVLDEDMCFFSGCDGINHFRNAWRSEDATKFWEEQ